MQAAALGGSSDELGDIFSNLDGMMILARYGRCGFSFRD